MGKRSISWISVSGFLLLCLVIIFALYHKMRDEVMPWYPRAFDQSGYLSQSYRLYDRGKSEGFVSVASKELWVHSSNGVLLAPEGALGMLLTKQVRLGCLSVNIAHLVVMLVALFAGLSLRYGLPSGFLVLGLYLASESLFLTGGGLDFRRDFSAECLYGTMIGLWFVSNGLERRASAVALGCCAALLVAARFISVTYICEIVGALCCFFAVGRLRTALGKNRAWGHLDTQRFKNLLLAAIPFISVAALLLVHNARDIFVYYGVGHFLGTEKQIRMAEWGTTEFWPAVSFYPRTLLMGHLGPACDLLLLGTVLVAVLSRLIGKKAPSDLRENSSGAAINTWFLSASILCPLLTLTADSAKAPVVANILVPSIVATAAFVFATLTSGGGLVEKIWPAFAFCAGLWLFSHGLARPSELTPPQPLAGQIDSVFEALNSELARGPFKTPRIAFLDTSEYFNANTLNAWSYEHHGKSTDCTSSLGGSVFAQTKENLFSGLEAADIVLLPDKPNRGPYPFFDSLRESWSTIRNYTLRNLSVRGTFPVGEQNVGIFVRSCIIPEGLSGEWISGEGIVISPEMWKNGDELELTVTVPSYARYSESPRPVITLADRNTAVPGLEVRVVKSGNELIVKIRDSGKHSHNDRVRIKFDRSFQPRQLGLNGDERHLSVVFNRLIFQNEPAN
jgi:hypothetical protein